MPLPSPDASAPCPCGRTGPSNKPLQLDACCGRFIHHFEATPAPDAGLLMRSRYTAFVLERADYLLATWHISQRPQTLTFDPRLKWLGLEVRQHRLLDTTHAEVEFVARQKVPGQPALRLHELSRFVQEAGRWFYLDGNLKN